MKSLRVKRQTSPKGNNLNNVNVNLPLIASLKTSEDVVKVKDMIESNGDTNKCKAKENSWFCTLRLTLNVLSHVLIGVVVVICLWFSCQSTKLGVIELHIVLCVLGYQFFMSHGILILSKFNSWSMYLKHRHRKNMHLALELIGAVLILVGSIYVSKDKAVNCNTLHGILGLCAMITTLISVLNGALTSLSTKFTKFGVNLSIATKWVHGVSGMGTLFLSTASLHYGYNKESFRRWIDDENFILALKIFTWMFTIFIGFEFWVIMFKRIQYKWNVRNAQGAQH